MEKAIQNLKEQLKTKDKQIALLEEKIAEQSAHVNRITNEMLALQAGTPLEATEHNGPVEKEETQYQPVPKSKTL